MLFTLIAVAIIAVILLLRFMRKPQNRHPLEGERERNIGEVLDHQKSNVAQPQNEHR
jgi:putative exporter of polyketide antibiotics